jgi:hypothetical protein
MQRSSESARKWPKRSFVVEVIAIPDAGKSSVIQGLTGRFNQQQILSQWLSQDRETNPMIATMKKNLQVLRNRRGSLQRPWNSQGAQLVSTIFLGIFKAHELIAQTSILEITFFEQGPYFTSIYERHWAYTPNEVLAYHFRHVMEPDFVLFLAVSPQELRRRGHSSAREWVKSQIKDLGKMTKVYNAMDEMAKKKGWERIEGEATRTLQGMIDSAFDKVAAAYEAYLLHPTPPKEFQFDPTSD